jgi:hypothetical protein
MSEKPARQGVSRSEARFRYDYDVRGNWIAKIVEGRSGARAHGDDRRLLDDVRVYSLRSTVAGSIAVARLAGT